MHAAAVAAALSDLQGAAARPHAPTSDRAAVESVRHGPTVCQGDSPAAVHVDQTGVHDLAAHWLSAQLCGAVAADVLDSGVVADLADAWERGAKQDVVAILLARPALVSPAERARFLERRYRRFVSQAYEAHFPSDMI